ncbi:uncharacterized protein E0L32_007723 [Thyridium curvatum]|uniref:Heterokaryon incompatibility domain-containing protein n=1 Tax=Thyridium curvatum TaxID=1093900 RepID=A0A507ANM3_9PEZI|nr:uncharacterized protein E0L32_007723 [Thyridium curvatum]TPX11512.1 hypothetical protein E0L32_007723 [Thyridium curvatum]
MKVTEDAANQGCPFCSLIIETFRKGMPTEDWDRLNRQKLWFHMSVGQRGEWWGSKPEGEGLGIGRLDVELASITYGFPLSVTGTGLKTFHVVADLGDVAYTSGDVRGTYVNENTESETYLLEIKWRRDKCFSHETCCKTLSGNRQIDCRQVVLPTRCIDVLGPGLHIAETGCETSSYLILSHRWTPDTAACATTAGNIEQRRRGGANALLSLPKTFLDLFDLARGLGVRYVWIDSICIIQQGDGGQDWNQEAPKMGDYYQQAMLTVCATSGDKGLFQARTYSKAVPDIARLPFRNREGARQGFFYVYPYSNKDQNMLLDDEIIQGSKLLTRGWVFQEWLLSRRLVYFTPAGMIYECVTAGMSDDRGEVWDSQKLTKGLLPWVQEAFGDRHSRMWYRLVEIYSSKSLTCPVKDIIMALAGVAKEFGDAMMRRASGGSVPVTTVHCGLEYLSGLWAYDLHRGLLWERKVFNGQHRRLHGYPSWSWTSTIGTVVWETNPVGTRPPSSLTRAWCGADPAILYPEAKFLAASTLEGNVLSFSGTPLTTAERFSRPPANTFSTLNKFAILRIEGKLARFVVRETFSEDEDMRPLFDLCGDAVDLKSAQTLWRKLSGGGTV